MHRLGQEDQNKILADHFLFSWGISRDMPPKGRSKRHLERFTSVSARIRAPSADTVDSFTSWPFSHFSPSNHSTARYDPGKALRDPYAQKECWHLPQCDRTLDVVNEEHCDRNTLVSVATDDVDAYMALIASPMDQNHVKSR